MMERWLAVSGTVIRRGQCEAVPDVASGVRHVSVLCPRCGAVSMAQVEGGPTRTWCETCGAPYAVRLYAESAS